MTISIISACKNRGKALSISLSSWVQFDEVTEIVIVDWSSDEPISHLTSLDSRIKVITVKGEKYFNQPQPLNLAASITTGDCILKLDSDTIINPYYNFFDHHKIDDNCFMTGITESNLNIFHNEKVEKKEKSPFFDPLWGTLFLTKENYFKIGGYNENMDEYAAWEDNEIVERLKLLGLKHEKINLKLKTLFSIPHSSKERVENFRAYKENKNLEISIREQLIKKHNLKNENIVHKLILESHNRINWNKYKLSQKSSYFIKPVIKWNLSKLSDNHYLAEKTLNK
jgi:GT2 family glycosyltransferase